MEGRIAFGQHALFLMHFQKGRLTGQAADYQPHEYLGRFRNKNRVSPLAGIWRMSGRHEYIQLDQANRAGVRFPTATVRSLFQLLGLAMR